MDSVNNHSQIYSFQFINTRLEMIICMKSAIIDSDL